MFAFIGFCFLVFMFINILRKDNQNPPVIKKDNSEFIDPSIDAELYHLQVRQYLDKHPEL